MSYPNLTLIVGGEERSDGSAGTLRLSDPADGSLLTTAPRAGRPEALEAAAAAEQGGAEWAALSALERSRIMRRAADIMRERADVAARVMSMEQGKPLAEARGEWLGSADLLDTDRAGHVDMVRAPRSPRRRWMSSAASSRASARSGWSAAATHSPTSPTRTAC